VVCVVLVVIAVLAGVLVELARLWWRYCC